MELVFDISQDELPIFLAESEDHLQILDEGLIRLERQEYDSELIQQIFRAAHTLKGTAGMIGHQRLVELTHALEMAFDCIRKNELTITTHLVDICLDAVDALRHLRDEVLSGQSSSVDVASLVEHIHQFIQIEKQAMAAGSASVITAQVIPAKPAQVGLPNLGGMLIEANISSKSIASAARAFQLMLALQELGEILEMKPSQEEIETAAPVAIFSARLKTDHTPAEVQQALDNIFDIDKLSVQDSNVPSDVQPKILTMPGEEKQALSDLTDDDAPHLGEYLVSEGFITQVQLEQGLEIQKSQSNPKELIGHVLVKMGLLSVDVLDRAIADLLQKQRATIQTLQQVSPGKAKPRTSEKTVRTSVERLDSLMNLVGELITDRNRLFKIRNDLDRQLHGNEEINFLMEAVAHIGRITDQLQEEVMRIRMLPVSNVFNKFPRMVRDLAQKVNKDINLVIQGQDTELDRSVIEEINDPLIHLLRNSVDHGLETSKDRLAKGKSASGTIRLTARHEQGRIILTVEDDGKGIDLEKVKQSAIQKGIITELEASQMTDEKAVDLIFASGVSAAKQVTDISGRGVGMDIVRNNIEKINGSILVDTHPGIGTRFQIILPLTLAIVPTLLVRVGPITLAVPLVMVTETLRIKPDETHTINGHPVILLRNQVLPIMKLGDVFDLSMDKVVQQYSYVVVVSSNKLRIGLVVDSLIGEEEVVVKSLGGLIGDIAGISSAAILGDGQVALIVDVSGLFKLAGINNGR